MPQPDRGGKVFQRDNNSGKPVSFRRVVRRPKLQNHLLFCTEIQGLEMPTLTQIPDMERMAIASLQENFRIDPGFDHVGRAPLTGDQRVMPKMPPEIIGKILRSPLDLPLAQNFEAVGVKDEDASGAFTTRSAE